LERIAVIYKGHVKNGTIHLDEPMELPEGASVRIELDIPKSDSAQDLPPTLAERLASIIGKAEGLPVDWSVHHDHYLHDECPGHSPNLDEIQ
jgi:hypothetical protein